MLCCEDGDGWQLSEGDTVTCTFRVNSESLSKNDREDITALFFLFKTVFTLSRMNRLLSVVIFLLHTLFPIMVYITLG